MERYMHANMPGDVEDIGDDADGEFAIDRILDHRQHPSGPQVLLKYTVSGTRASMQRPCVFLG